MNENIIFSDQNLARRLERAEARSAADFVEARAQLFPDSGAEWIEVAGAFAMFDGANSPCTQTFGLGLFERITNVEMDKLELFFNQRGAPVFHEVSPLADVSLLTLLDERGYHPIELTSVMHRPIRRDVQLAAPRNEKIQVRIIQEDEAEIWTQTTVRGWSEFEGLGDFMLEVGKISAKSAGAVSFLAEIDGQPIAAAALFICDGVALLAGASTVPEGRKQGAQLALLDARLRCAAEHNCDIAMIGAQPGSASQRNAERHGFRIAYTRIKWLLAQRAA